MASKSREKRPAQEAVTSGVDYKVDLDRKVRDMVDSNRKVHDTGAVRSRDAEGVRYDLISPVGLRRLAETYDEGSKKYSDHNWRKGFKFSDVLNHAMKHIEQWRSGDTSEDHLAHAAWNLFTLMDFEETLPAMNDIPARLESA